MVYYPTAADIVEANKIALAMTKDKHPHKLRGSLVGIHHRIDEIKKREDKGLTFQAACFMKEITTLHWFDGANHRTGYLVTLLFLTRNGFTLKKERPKAVDEFMKEISSKEMEEVREWIEKYMI